MWRSITDTSRNGQVMLLTVLTLGGTLLGVTTIAGLLMIYQVRQSTDLSQSAKALFAADAGIEWGLYNIICDAVGASPGRPCPIPAPPTFTNGATLTVICLDGNGSAVEGCASQDVVSIRSRGSFNNISRAFCVLEGCAATSSSP